MLSHFVIVVINILLKSIFDLVFLDP